MSLVKNMGNADRIIRSAVAAGIIAALAVEKLKARQL